MKIAMSACVYYSLDHLFPQHGGVAHRNENCNVYMYIIPLITYFLNMEGVAERNENCNVCMCILFPWSRISPNMEGFFREMRIAMSVRVYYSLDHLFSRHGGGCWEKLEFQCLHVYIIPLITYFPKHEGGCSQKWEFARSVCVYYSLDHLFPKHGGGCSKKWELQCLYVYIIPLITYFPSQNENCNGCILFSHFPKWELLTAMRIPMYVYIIPLITYFTNMEGVALEKWELQCLYVYIIPLITYFPIWMGSSQKWELQCMYVYIIPLITYFPNMEGVAHRNKNCNVCVCILFLWSPISPTWMGLLSEMRIAMSVCVYYSFDHLFPQHGGGCSQKWELQCLYVYTIP